MQDKLVNRLSKKKNITLERSNELWEQAEQIAIANGQAGEIKYISSMFKKLMGEKLSFKDFLTLIEEGEPTNSSDGTMPDKKPTDGKPKKKKKAFSNIKKNRNVTKDGDTDLDTEKDETDAKGDESVAKVN